MRRDVEKNGLAGRSSGFKRSLAVTRPNLLSFAHSAPWHARHCAGAKERISVWLSIGACASPGWPMTGQTETKNRWARRYSAFRKVLKDLAHQFLGLWASVQGLDDRLEAALMRPAHSPKTSLSVPCMAALGVAVGAMLWIRQRPAVWRSAYGGQS